MSPEPQSQKQKITAQLARRKDKLRTLRHREAQRKYRERNKEALRDKARVKMKEYRAEVKESEPRKKMAAELRREPDADYRERQRQKKILAKFGEKLFNEVYTPLYRLHGNQTFKFKIEWDEEGESEEERERVREDGAEAAQILADSEIRQLASKNKLPGTSRVLFP